MAWMAAPAPVSRLALLCAVPSGLRNALGRRSEVKRRREEKMMRRKEQNRERTAYLTCPEIHVPV